MTLKGFEGDPTVVFDEAKFVNLQQNGKIVEGDASVNVKDGAFLNRSNRIGTGWLTWEQPMAMLTNIDKILK